MANNQVNINRMLLKLSSAFRGAMDGWFFMYCVIGAVFYKLMSDSFVKYQANINGYIDYEERSDDDAFGFIKHLTIRSQGFFLYPSQLYGNVVKNIDKYSDVAATLDIIFKAFENSAIGYPSEEAVKGLFSDFNVLSDQLGKNVEEKNKHLKILLEGVASLELNRFRTNPSDLFGEVYEFVKSKSSTAFIKSSGEYFTPPNLAQLTARLALHGMSEVGTVYDPTCGSGSLLLQIKKNIKGIKIKNGFVGQEINPTTYNLARMNMLLHGVHVECFDIVLGDTLTNPKFATNSSPLKPPFDVIVSNPPVSVGWAGEENPSIVADKRFASAGAVPSKSKADFAFILHTLHYLSENGRACIICAPGVLHRRGREQRIRQYLVSNNYVDAVIALPDKLFENARISVNILILRKNKNNPDVKFVCADSFYETFNKQNKIQQKQVEKILELYSAKDDEPNLTKTVTIDQIKNNNYSLNVYDYIQPKKEGLKIDINAVDKEREDSLIYLNKIREEVDTLIRKRKIKEGMLTDTALLKDLVVFEKSGDISKKYVQEHKGIYPVYSAKTSGDGVFGYIDSYDFDGEYLAVTAGGTFCGQVIHLNKKFSATRFRIVLKIKDTNIVSYPFLKSFLNVILPLNVPKGFIIRRLHWWDIENIKVPLFSKEYQQEAFSIAEKFDLLLDSRGGVLNKLLDLEKQRQDYYLKMFYGIKS